MIEREVDGFFLKSRPERVGIYITIAKIASIAKFAGIVKGLAILAILAVLAILEILFPVDIHPGRDKTTLPLASYRRRH